MTCTILRNPYAAVLCGIIIKVSQGTGNTLAKVHEYTTLQSDSYYEYNTNSGAGNPLDWLHPNCEGGVA